MWEGPIGEIRNDYGEEFPGEERSKKEKGRSKPIKCHLQLKSRLVGKAGVKERSCFRG